MNRALLFFGHENHFFVVNCHEAPKIGGFGLFLVMINAKKINSWLGGSGWLYRDIVVELWIKFLIVHNLTT